MKTKIAWSLAFLVGVWCVGYYFRILLYSMYENPSALNIMRGALGVKERAGDWRDEGRGEITGLDQLLASQWFPDLRQEGGGYADPFSGAPASLARVEDENGKTRLALVFKGVEKNDCKRMARAYAEVAWQEMYHDEPEREKSSSPEIRVGLGGLLGLAGPRLRVDGREWLNPLSQWMRPEWVSNTLRGWEVRLADGKDGSPYWFDGIKITNSMAENGPVHMSRSQLRRMTGRDAYSYEKWLPRLCENARGSTLNIVFVGL